jgi:hypothetical protein
MYVNSNVATHNVVMEMLITNIESLIWKYRVNLALWGHMHTMQRQSAVFAHHVIQRPKMQELPSTGAKSYVAVHDDPQSTVHVVVGTGGASLNLGLRNTIPQWYERSINKFGYGSITPINATHLLWEWTNSEDHVVHDRMLLTQTDPVHTSSWTLPWYLRISSTVYYLIIFVIGSSSLLGIYHVFTKSGLYLNGPRRIISRNEYSVISDDSSL